MCSTVQFSKKSILSEQTDACIPSWKCLSTFVPFRENARITSLSTDWLLHDFLAIVYEDASARISCGSARERIVQVIVRCRILDSRRARDVGSGLYAYLRSRRPCLAVYLRLRHKLHVACRGRGRQGSYLLSGGVLKLSADSRRAPRLAVEREIHLVVFDHAIARVCR